MKKLVAILTVIMAYFAGAQAHATIDGLWLTENKRAAIELKSCDNGDGPLCGYITWIIDGGMQVDEKNENPDLRGQPLCGMKILYGFEQGQKDGEWVDGKIYKADDGDLYNANLQMIDENRLRLRGYVGIPLFGKTQIWNKVSKADYPACKN